MRGSRAAGMSPGSDSRDSIRTFQPTVFERRIESAPIYPRTECFRMNLWRPASRAPRLQNLEGWPLVAAVFLIGMGLFLAGILHSTYGYEDPRFVIGFFGTELQVTVFLAFVTVWLLQLDRIGLRLPRWPGAGRLAPLAILAAVILGSWWVTRLSLPEGVVPDTADAWLVLRSTVFVGINEEWIFLEF